VYEIEAKLKVDSLQELESKLAELGARFLAEQLQIDSHFDDANATFARTDRCFRLRRQKDDKGERFFLTYKGAKEKSSFKKRQEIEIEIKDADLAEKFLSALGYEKALVVEKTRRVWQLDECEVALDHLPLLGDFVEIEGPDEKIASVQKNLGLSILPHIPKGYAALVKAKLRELTREQKGRSSTKVVESQ
jgi:predicted adenylyl cyclase CyaB